MRRKKSVITVRRRHPGAAGGLPKVLRATVRRVPRGRDAGPPVRAVAQPSDDQAIAPVDLSVDLAPSRPGRLVLTSPILAAAGCLGYGLEAAEQVDLARFGAIVTRGTTLAPRTGSPPPRMVEAPAALLHAIGLQNPGIEVVLDRSAPRWSTWRVPVILSLAAASPEDFASLARRCDVPGVTGLELDLASVDLARSGRPISLEPGAAARATEAAREVTDLPLLVKLSVAASDVRGVVRAVVDAGADAVTCGGGMPAAAIDRDGRRALLGGVHATLSGPALRPVVLRVVAEASSATKVPIIGCGGVTSLPDVIDLLLAGATAVQIGTALLADPSLPLRLADELAAHCRDLGLASSRELVGAVGPLDGGRRARR